MNRLDGFERLVLRKGNLEVVLLSFLKTLGGKNKVDEFEMKPLSYFQSILWAKYKVNPNRFYLYWLNHKIRHLDEVGSYIKCRVCGLIGRPSTFNPHR